MKTYFDLKEQLKNRATATKKSYPKPGSGRDAKQGQGTMQRGENWPSAVRKHETTQKNKKLGSLFDKHDKMVDHHMGREEHHMNETDNERKIAHHGISVSNHNAAMFHINHAAHTVSKLGEKHPKSQSRIKNAMRVSKFANQGPSKAQVSRHIGDE